MSHLGPGEAIKEVKIVVDQTQLDLSQAYALAFTLTDPGGAVINSGQVDAIYQVGVKNKYDGSYSTDITTTAGAHTALPMA